VSKIRSVLLKQQEYHDSHGTDKIRNQLDSPWAEIFMLNECMHENNKTARVTDIHVDL